MNISDISRFMNIYLMQSMMGSNGGENSLGGAQGNSSNSVLFEYMLKSSMAGNNNNYCNCRYTMNNTLLNSNNNNNSDKVVNQGSNQIYGEYGDFIPMGKAPNLREKDINISPRIDEAIKAACRKYGVEESFVRGIIKQESNFNPNCTSGAGAKGLMQLMDYNCTEYGVKNPYNVEDNINGGVKYIKELLDKFDGNKQLALSAYNGGITRMRKRGVDTVPEIVNMPKETRDYVTKVMGYYNQYKDIKLI
ncbi:MAG: lytic transglycosylase domain-containing protein [Clostridium sp.]